MTARDVAVAALHRLGNAGRKAPGKLHIEVTQQANRPNHFTVVKAWASGAAFDANASAAVQIAFRDRLGPMAGALHDERI